MSSPCLRCTRVENPRECENKNCTVWRNWFVSRWETLRRQPRLVMETRPKEMEGVSIGGVTYALPHRVENYLGNDPCKGCLVPRDLCVLPCRVKRAWTKAREDVFLS